MQFFQKLVMKLFFSSLMLAFVVVLIVVSNLGLNLFRFQVSNPKIITVTGMAKDTQASQLARFSASVSESGESKESVNLAMEEKISAIVEAVKTFGLSEDNIKTQYFNIYQEEMTDYDSGTPIVKKGPWRGNTNVSFDKVPADKAQEITDILVSTGATSIDGPTFSLDEISEYEVVLGQKALVDARDKATQLAESQGFDIGEIISISENSNIADPMLYRFDMGGGGGAFNPGTQEISKIMVVTFELK